MKLIDVYVDSTPEEIDALEAAIRAGDAEGAVRIAHRLKSVSANLGAADVAGALSRIEKRARAGDTAGLLDQLPILRRDHTLALQALHHERAAALRDGPHV